MMFEKPICSQHLDLPDVLVVIQVHTLLVLYERQLLIETR